MSWSDCKKKWSMSPEGIKIKRLSGKDMWELPELKEICEKFRRGYYTDETFISILKSEIKSLEQK